MTQTGVAHNTQTRFHSSWRAQARDFISFVSVLWAKETTYMLLHYAAYSAGSLLTDTPTRLATAGLAAGT